MVYYPQQKKEDRITGIIGFLNFHINYITLQIRSLAEPKEILFSQEIAKILLKCKSDIQETVNKQQRNEL